MPQTSIVIPNYNHQRYVGRAIESVLRQTYADYEVIVVDDGSTDGSRAEIARFGDAVRAIHQDNAGLSAARNIGIRAARGRYVGVLDADDEYEPDYLATMTGLLESNPDAEGAYCGYRFVDDEGLPLPQIERRAVGPDDLYQTLIEGNFLTPESMFLRKRCYDAVGEFDVSLRALEDLDMWLRVTSRFKIVHTTDVLTRHRVLPHSMSADSTRQFQNRFRVLEKHRGPVSPDDDSLPELTRRVYGRGYLTSAVEFLQSKQDRQAISCLREMARVCPKLLTEIETFYELGCGAQAKGYRGDFASLNLDQSRDEVLRFLEEIFKTDFPARSAALRTEAYATAYYVLGLLYYGRDQTASARHCLLEAFTRKAALLRERNAVALLAKSLLGPTLLKRLKRMRSGSRLA